MGPREEWGALGISLFLLRTLLYCSTIVTPRPGAAGSSVLSKDQDGIGHLIDSFACVRKCNSPWVLQEQNADFSKKEASAHPDRNSRIRDRVRAGRKIPPGPFRSRDREAARAPAINTVLIP